MKKKRKKGRGTETKMKSREYKKTRNEPNETFGSVLSYSSKNSGELFREGQDLVLRVLRDDGEDEDDDEDDFFTWLVHLS